MTFPGNYDELADQIRRDLIDGYDEELEMEIEDRSADHARAGLDSDVDLHSERQPYFRNPFRLQRELVKLQDWVAHSRQCD